MNEFKKWAATPNGQITLAMFGLALGILVGRLF